jgi:carboxymethylenebutenolidase
VPYYGTVDVNRIPDIKTAAVLALYGANDNRVTGQATEVESRMKAAGKTFEMKIYPGAGHQFFNDTANAYNAEAASDAWASTIAWFRKYLV